MIFSICNSFNSNKQFGSCSRGYNFPIKFQYNNAILNLVSIGNYNSFANCAFVRMIKTTISIHYRSPVYLCRISAACRYWLRCVVTSCLSARRCKSLVECFQLIGRRAWTRTKNDWDTREYLIVVATHIQSTAACCVYHFATRRPINCIASATTYQNNLTPKLVGVGYFRRLMVSQKLCLASLTS